MLTEMIVDRHFYLYFGTAIANVVDEVCIKFVIRFCALLLDIFPVNIEVTVGS